MGCERFRHHTRMHAQVRNKGEGVTQRRGYFNLNLKNANIQAKIQSHRIHHSCI